MFATLVTLMVHIERFRTSKTVDRIVKRYQQPDILVQIHWIARATLPLMNVLPAKTLSMLNGSRIALQKKVIFCDKITRK